MKREYLQLLLADGGDPPGRDRLEILTALIDGPSFDPLYRPDIIKIPHDHPVYRWICVVAGCERTRTGGADLCTEHQQEWARACGRGAGKAAFVTAGRGLERRVAVEELPCRVCSERPVQHGELVLCKRHMHRWERHQRLGGGSADFGEWLSQEEPLPGYGHCLVVVCPGLAESPLGLCWWHATRYRSDGSPGGAALPGSWWHRYERFGKTVPAGCADQRVFRRWCATAPAQPRPGQVNLRGLRPLVKTEIKWGMFIHTQRARPTRWDLFWIQSLVTTCRDLEVNSLTGLEPGAGGYPKLTGAITREMLHELRLVYFTPDQAREAGFLETEHFGVLFPRRTSHIDLTGIPQRWLRDLTWDHLAALLRSPRCPRTITPVDTLRRAVTELGTFLEAEALGGGHDPALLRAGHAQRFAADQRHREREGLPSLAIKKPDGSASTVTAVTRTAVFSGIRRLLREAMDTGAAERLGLDREFITAFPAPGNLPKTARRPFPDNVARALAEEANLAVLAATYDPGDRGARDIWETAVTTGRRISEVIGVRWDSIGRYGGLAMFWHDQAKVGNYNAAIRIPERLHDLLAERQRETLDRFTARYGYRPSGEQRCSLALFPTPYRSNDRTVALTHQWFLDRFRAWVDGMDLGHCVPHQARHTLATSLLRHGATLTHIRRYLGQVSDRMAEHYSCRGRLLHLPARRDGGACPWNLDCHNCRKFVLSGADLLYWRRKREQWRLLAEGAPDDATATYLHGYFEPTARAIDGLEKALAGLGLLDDALALDLRKPQDYYHCIWSTAFRASDLADGGAEEDYGQHDTGEDGHRPDTQAHP